MKHSKQSQSIRRAQKESQLFQEISKLFLAISLDDSELRDIFVNRVKISDDGGICFIFFYSVHGLKGFEEKLGKLILYKPSLRRALAKIIQSRYVPELVFRFDDQFEKQERIDTLFEKIKE